MFYKPLKIQVNFKLFFEFLGMNSALFSCGIDAYENRKENTHAAFPNEVPNRPLEVDGRENRTGDFARDARPG